MSEWWTGLAILVLVGALLWWALAPLRAWARQIREREAEKQA